MSKNTSELTTHKRLSNEIQELKRILDEVRTTQQNVFIIPKVSSDPSNPIEGQIWENTTSHVLKIRLNGVTKTITVS